MGHVVSSRVVGVLDRSAGRVATLGSPRRGPTRRLPAAWIAWVLSVATIAMVVTAGLRLAAVLAAPGIGSFPPIP
jgi:hypothetical protein